jgi:hypothetical protein
VFDAGPDVLSASPALTVAANGDVVALWPARQGLYWIFGQGTGWSTPALLTQDLVSDLTVAGNSAGEVTAKWSPRRMVHFSPAGGWQPTPADNDPQGDSMELSNLRVLVDGTTVYTKRDISGSVFAAQLMEMSLSGGTQVTSFPGWDQSQAITTWNTVRGLLHLERRSGVAANPAAVHWRVLTPPSVTMIAEAPGYCSMGSTTSTRHSPLFGAMSDLHHGIVAATLARSNAAGSNPNGSCELTVATIDPVGAAAVRKLTPPDRYLDAIPVVAAGGSLAMVLWKESSTAGSEPGLWYSAHSVSSGALSTPEPLLPGLQVLWNPALVIRHDGTATVAVAVSAKPATLTSLQRIFVGDYSPSTGWRNWRFVYAGFATAPPMLATSGAGETVLGFGGIPCDRQPAIGELTCDIRRNGGVFIVRNP